LSLTPSDFVQQNTANTVTVHELVEDPNIAFSDEMCEVLSTKGVLIKEPWLDVNGKHAHYEQDGKKVPVWQYVWNSDSGFWDLDEATLLEVGWDLRYTRGFYNLNAFNVPAESAEGVKEEAEGEHDDDTTDSDDGPDYFNSNIFTS
jgi:hypothetical protein